MKKLLLAAFFACVVCGCTSTTNESFRFAIMGDTRPPPSGRPVEQTLMFARNIEMANESGGDFAVIVGDLIFGCTDDPALVAEEWDHYDAALRRFMIPVYSVPGNHDVWNDASLAIWTERYGDAYFSWDHKGAHFVALCSELPGEVNTVTGGQFEWLKRDLKKTGAKHIFVFLHKPLWKRDYVGSDGVDRWAPVHELFARHGVSAVFAGHEHEYCMYPEVDGVSYFVTGGGGAELGGSFLQGAFYHIMVADVSASSFDLRLVSQRGDLPLDFTTPAKVGELDRGMRVRQLLDLKVPGPLLVHAVVPNPTDVDCSILVNWDLAGSGWVAEDEVRAAPARSTQSFDMVASIPDRLYPLPGLEIELADGDLVYHTWEVAVEELVADATRVVSNWNVIGPFALGPTEEDVEQVATYEEYFALPMPGWDDVLPAEEKVDLDATYDGKFGPVRWTAAAAGPVSAAVDFRTVYSGNLCVGLAVSYVRARNEGEYCMLLRSDDGAVVRVNGTEAHRAAAMRGIHTEQDVIPVTFDKGWNEVLLKVSNHGGASGFTCRFVDPNGDLDFRARGGAD
jgi:hypothetical protein